MSAGVILAVAYYRMSTAKQEASVSEQRQAVLAYAAKHGYRVIREYVDEGISGDATEKRLEFQRMLRDATERGDFVVVLCWDQDRFGRFDPLEAGYWIKPLRDAGVRLETVAQGKIDWEDFAGRIGYFVQQEGKHAFLRDLSRNSMRGKLSAAREGRWNGGKPPYGYAVAEEPVEGRAKPHKHLVPGDPAQVAIVRELFRRYATTPTSLRALANDLNARGIRTATGRTWTLVAVHDILRHPAYVGDYRWNRRRFAKYTMVTNGAVEPAARGQSGPSNEHLIVKKQTHEPLIDRETFSEVQRKLKGRRSNTCPKRSGPFALTGLLVCGHCGHKMHGTLQRRKKEKRRGHYTYRLYKCSGYGMRGLAVCNLNYVHEGPIVDCLVRKIQEAFRNPEMLARLKEEIRREAMREQQKETASPQQLQKQLTAIDRKIADGTERLLSCPADLMEVASAKLREWQQQREAIQARLDALAGNKQPEQAADVEELVAKALKVLSKLREHLKDADIGMLREAISEMVEKVECWFADKPRSISRGLIHLRDDGILFGHDRHATTRLTAGFEYIGPPLPRHIAEKIYAERSAPRTPRRG